jgi:tol-pal system protein YbgF
MLKRLPLLFLCLPIFAGAWLLPAAAQVSDPRIIQLEEQVRQLNGRIEELNFQMLQMQDQMRRMQEDYEFRFQQLEDNQQGSLTPSDPPQADRKLAQDKMNEAAPKGDRLDAVEDQIAADVNAGSAGWEGSQTLGTLSVDPDGNITGADIDFSGRAIDDALDGGAVSSVTLTGTPDEIYTEGYRHVLDGDYKLAEAVFASFIATYPSDPLVADAKFWLGESLLSQGRFEDAADVFIDARTEHPDADKAPETMFKIGKIMAALGNRDVACATFADALARFDAMAATTRSAINTEQANAKC